MWERPHDVASWRAFWHLPDGHEDFTEDDWTRWHEWRCDVLEERYGLGVHYDEAEADRRLRFFRALPLTQGRWAGQRFVPMPWQEQLVLRALYGYVREDGTRLFHECFVYVAKKNGKGDLAAGVVLDQLFLEDEAGAEVYGAAKNSKQAAIVYQRAQSMVKASPPLRQRCHLLESVKRVRVPNPQGADSFYQVLSADVGSLEGPSMQCLVADEVHVIPAALLDVITDGSGAAREQPLKLYTTTAGNDFSMPWYDLLQFAQGVEDGVIESPYFLPVLFMLRPDEGDDWMDEATWSKANPSLGVTITLDGLREEFEKAKAMPAKQASFKRRRLNIPVADDALRYLPMSEWDACGPTGSLATLAEARERAMTELAGQQAVGWLDLSSRTDITTFGLLFPRPDGVVVPLPWFFIPKENLDKRGERDRAHYRQWAEYGFIELTEGNVTDYRALRTRINALRETFVFREIAYDDWNAGKIEQELLEDGFTMVPVKQSISSMNPGTKELLSLTMSGKLHHLGNPVLRYMADNLAVRMDQNERVQPMKNKSTGRIDGIVGIVMALDRIIRHEEAAPPPQPYKDRDVLVLG